MEPQDGLKRAFDIVASAGALLVLAPLLIGIALAVRLADGTPVLFCQERVGLNGVSFQIHKFRTMRQAVGPQVTARSDPRITPLGRFLRRSKLDELPQLWDVLRGRMSIVGPRPEVPEMVRLYSDEARRRILSVRPGLTDPATLILYDEEALLLGPDPERTYVEEILPRKIALYLDYVETRSFRGDLVLILRTLAALVAIPGRATR